MLEGVQLWRKEIQNADDETRRYMLDRLHAVCKLRRDDTDLWVDIRLQLDEDGESYLEPISIPTVRPAFCGTSPGYRDRFLATIDLRTALQATHERCCDNRPAPKNQDGRSG